MDYGVLIPVWIVPGEGQGTRFRTLHEKPRGVQIQVVVFFRRKDDDIGPQGGSCGYDVPPFAAHLKKRQGESQRGPIPLGTPEVPTVLENR